ncbi:DUF4178 domain-containing protein [Olleya sp. YSTF-M6]|uniref:DUF4178 domain-containing protein n=1 Tax=Olleya sediminilitoris TaxID=2795739 RepID=A0ABS1WI48_9FLAO|nr:DUF4178 domain-containing protein [Olleya sediminilitoris]MBL7558791.1 DUF4178 domain-containing protein [Olleya sediminilitoris]
MFENKSKYPLNKLKVGFTFKLFKQKWTITEIAEYSWNTGNMSVEYTIENTDKKAFLEVEFYKGKFEVIYSEALTLNNINLDLIIEDGYLIFENKKYNLEETFSGSYRNMTTFTSTENLISYQFYLKDNCISVEKWDDGSIESFIGEEIKPKKITNINTL